MADNNIVGEIQTYLDENPPDQLNIPDSVGDAEAVNAVQEHYDEAGLECTEQQAEEIVRDARRS